MDDEQLVEGDDARDQDGYGLAVLAARVGKTDERATFDQLPAWAEDVDAGPTAARRGASHAFVPSWSVRFIAGVTETKSGLNVYSGSVPSSSGGHSFTATMAAAGDPST